MSPLKKDKAVVLKAEEEELPPGWKKELKLRKSGSTTRVDKHYTDPVTGCIFHSFKDVQRYLKTGEVGKLASKPKCNDAVDMDNAIEPSGKKSIEAEEISGTWRHKRPLENGSEPKTRHATRQAGIQIDAPPSSASDTRSSRQPEPKTRQATRQAGIKIETPPTSRQATPLSRASVNATTPSSSPPEPKTRRATRHSGIKIDTPLPSPPDSKTRQTTRQSGMKADVSVPLSPEPKTSEVARPPEPKTRQAKQAAGMEIDAQYSSLPDPKARKATRDSGINVNATVHKPEKTTRVVEMEIDASPPSLPEPKSRKATRRSKIEDNSIPSSPSEPKTRRATRQSGIKIESPPSSPPDTRTSRRVAETVKLATPKKIVEKAKVENADVADKQENSVVLPPVSQEKVNKDDFDPSENQESHILLHSTPKESHKEIVTGPAPLPPVSHITTEQQLSLPTVQQPNSGMQIDTKCYEKQKSPVVSAPTSNPMPQYSFGADVNTNSSINFSLNDLWTDPCIEFAVKTLTGAIPFSDLNKVDNFAAASPVEVPMEELWTDPCIEFAVKTLTGAIPIEKHDYLSHQSASSSKPHAVRDFTLPDVVTSFSQTEVLSQHFETGRNNKQQESVVVPTHGNGGLQKAGNKFMGQVVNGSNGQCSRSRLFQ